MKENIRSVSLKVLFVFAMMSCTTNDPGKKEWIQLFNGKDLKDWDVKISGYELNNNFGNTFKVDSGRLVVGYQQYDSFRNKFGHIFYRKKIFPLPAWR